MPCVSLIAAPNLRSPRAGRGVLKSMSQLQALEQSSRVDRRKNFKEEKFGISYCFETTIDIY